MGYPWRPRRLTDRIPVSRSSDGGRTWTGPTFVDDPAEVGIDVDTIAAEPDVRGAMDVVWNPDELFAAPQTVVLSRSRDGGRTWTDHRIGTSSPGAISCERVIALRDGTLLVTFTESTPVGAVAGAAGLPLPGSEAPLRVVRSSRDLPGPSTAPATSS